MSNEQRHKARTGRKRSGEGSGLRGGKEEHARRSAGVVSSWCARLRACRDGERLAGHRHGLGCIGQDSGGGDWCVAESCRCAGVC